MADNRKVDAAVEKYKQRGFRISSLPHEEGSNEIYYRGEIRWVDDEKSLVQPLD